MPSRAAHPSNGAVVYRALRGEFQCPLGRLTLRTRSRERASNLGHQVSMPSRAAHPSNAVRMDSGSRAQHAFQCPLGRLTLRTSAWSWGTPSLASFNALSGGSPFELRTKGTTGLSREFQCPLGRLTLRTTPGLWDDETCSWFQCPLGRLTLRTATESCVNLLDREFQCPRGRLTLQTRWSRASATASGTSVSMPSRAAHPSNSSPLRRRWPGGAVSMPFRAAHPSNMTQDAGSADARVVSMPSRAAHPSNPSEKGRGRAMLFQCPPGRLTLRTVPVSTESANRFNALSGGSPFERPDVTVKLVLRLFQCPLGPSPFERRRGEDNLIARIVSMPSRAVRPSNDRTESVEVFC